MACALSLCCWRFRWVAWLATAHSVKRAARDCPRRDRRPGRLVRRDGNHAAVAVGCPLRRAGFGAGPLVRRSISPEAYHLFSLRGILDKHRITVDRAKLWG